MLSTTVLESSTEDIDHLRKLLRAVDNTLQELFLCMSSEERSLSREDATRFQRLQMYFVLLKHELKLLQKKNAGKISYHPWIQRARYNVLSCRGRITASNDEERAHFYLFVLHRFAVFCFEHTATSVLHD